MLISCSGENIAVKGGVLVCDLGGNQKTFLQHLFGPEVGVCYRLAPNITPGVRVDEFCLVAAAWSVPQSNTFPTYALHALLSAFYISLVDGGPATATVTTREFTYVFVVGVQLLRHD